MTEREDGYRQALADAEKVCLMMASSWMQRGAMMPEERQAVTKLIADALAVAGKSISDLEPGFVSPAE